MGPRIREDNRWGMGGFTNRRPHGRRLCVVHNGRRFLDSASLRSDMTCSFGMTCSRN